jgi:putative ABC transport system substrate-binding protein
MKRREFLTLVGGAAATWPLAAVAQQQALMPVVGFLNSESRDTYAAMVAAFRHGLNEVGFVEGRNVEIEYRWANGHDDQLPAMAADLVRRQVSVIAANTAATLAARAATETIPIVFSTSSDPVALGFVSRMNRPDGNVTGVSNLNVQLAPKRLEILRELVPSAKSVALLVNPTNPTVTETETKTLQAAADAFGLKIMILKASSENDFEPAFATLIRRGAGALIIPPKRHSPTAPKLSRWRRASQFQRSIQAAMFPPLGDLSATQPAFLTCIVWSVSTLVGFSKVKSHPTCQSSSPRKSNSL